MRWTTERGRCDGGDSGRDGGGRTSGLGAETVGAKDAGRPEGTIVDTIDVESASLRALIASDARGGTRGIGEGVESGVVGRRNNLLRVHC